MSSVALPSVPVVALVLALAGAGASGAVLTGSVPLNVFGSPAPVAASAAAGMEVLETFAGDVDLAAVQTGTLDLRTFDGPVHVIGWDEPAYEIIVYVAPEQGQHVKDGQIEAAFQEGSEGGLDLALAVAQTGTYDVAVNEQHGHRVAVVASVPRAIAWTQAYVCSGASGAWKGLGDTLGGLFGGRGEDRACVEGGQAMDINLGLGASERDATDEVVPFTIENLHGGELMATAQYADISVQEVAFDRLGLMSQYGSLQVAGAAGELAVLSQYGDIAVGAEASSLKAMSQYGDILAQLTGGDSGTIDLRSQYGSIALGVPPGADRGYDAQARTQYGEIVIVLSDAEEAGEDDGPATADAQGLLGSVLAPERPGQGERKHVTSAGFDAKGVQVTIAAETQYGDIVITDGDFEALNDDDDDA